MGQWSRMFPGQLTEVRTARAFTRAVLDGNPMMDDAVLVVSELVSNALQHSMSGEYGGPFIVAVESNPGSVWVSVVDLGAETTPSLSPTMPGPDRERGRGLSLVARLSKEWGTDQLPVGLRVWAELVPDGSS